VLTRRLLRWIDDRLGGAPFATKALNRVFPDHWSFMFGEVALYCFIILVGTGIYLSFFFEPSTREVVYDGSFRPLQGVEMSAAYRSALHISFDVRAGLVMRQMHHWAALLFVAAIVVHLARVFFTGAFRKPRDLNWMVGVTLLILAVVNGFFGYSLLDDLLSGTGLRVANAIMLSVPLIGPQLAFGLLGGEFPADATIPRFFVLHVLVVPAVIVAVLSVHLALVWRQKHTQFPGEGRTEENLVGERLWPVYALRGGALFFLVTAFLALLGGVAQINPIWAYGPFKTSQTTSAVSSASQPDWYMGWVDGALRLMPGWEFRTGFFTIPNPFFPGVLLPTLFIGGMFLWPYIEAAVTGDHEPHNLLQHPRDNPTRSGIGAAVIGFYAVLFTAGSNDVLSGIFNVAPETLTLAFRVLLFVVPIIAFFLTRRICRELRGTDVHPLSPPAEEVAHSGVIGGAGAGADDAG
jgi:ubiquinol-cytochrome c reductase cytochrome b subunit